MAGAAAPAPAVHDAATTREPHDLRLLPIVAGLWVAQALVLMAGPSAIVAALVLGVAVLLGAVVVLRVRGRRASAGRPAERPAGRSGLPALLTLVGLGLGAIVAGLHLARLHPPALAAVVEQRAVVQAQARITGDPVAHLPPPDEGGRPGAPSWSVAARLEQVVVRGRSSSLAAPVVLRGPAVRDLVHGSTVAFAARAASAWNPESRSMALQVLGTVAQRAPPGSVAEVTNRIRGAFRAACADLPPDAGALLLGLAVGDESTLPAALDEAMVRAGLAHLTAVSGSNTALVMGLALAAATVLGWGWRWRVVTSLMVLAGYVALVHPQPSVLRAAGMGVVAMVALGAGGRRRGTPALFAAALVLLVLVPSFALSLGFALSVAATAGLLLVAPSVDAGLARWPVVRRMPVPIRAALAVATAAHLATLPLSVLMGNGASLVALPANVLVTPLVPIATVLGLAAALLAPLWLPAAAVLAHVAAPATATIAWIAHTASGTPFGVVALPGGATSALIAAAALGLGALWATGRWRVPTRRGWVVVATAVAVVTLLVARLPGLTGWPPSDWVVLACDVGQGDGVLLRAPGSGEALLVDVGPRDAGAGRCAQRAGISRVVVLLTHFHADHVEGLDDVLGRLQVQAVLASPVLEPQQGAQAALAAAIAAGVPVRWLRAGQRLTTVGVDLDVRWPARAIADSPANNASIVAVASIPVAGGPVRVLLTGDVEPEAQQAIMAGPAPQAHVVKVPHHGSRLQAPGFAAWSGARIALVTVGRDNDYGHPSAQTLAAYQRLGALIGRTDEQGALVVAWRAGRLALQPQR